MCTSVCLCVSFCLYACLPVCVCVCVLLTVVVVHNLEILHRSLRNSAVEIEHIRLRIYGNTPTQIKITDPIPWLPNPIHRPNSLQMSTLCQLYKGVPM